MTIRKSIELADGEVTVSPSGMYTKAHFYEHPETGRKVLLTGLLHTGAADYYEKAKALLEKCDTVLYEPIKSVSTSKADVKSVESECGQFEGDNVTELLMFLIGKYFIYLDNGFAAERYIKEGEVFNELYQADNWHCADLLPDFNPEEEGFMLDEDDDTRFEDNLYSSISALVSPKKLEIIETLLRCIEKLRNEDFSSKDYAETFVELYSNPEFLSLLVHTLSIERDFKCLSVFDMVVADDEPDYIGIKFGAFHMVFQRKLLELRGYKHIKSTKLRAISF